MIALLELLDDFTHLLGLVATAYQEGVGGVDDDHVVEPDGCDQAVFALDEAVAAVDIDDFAYRAVALLVGCDQLGQRMPGTDVAPVETSGYNDDILPLFHDGVVDGNVFDPAEGGFINVAMRISAFARRRFPTCFALRQQLRRMPAERFEQGLDGEAEHAGVPVVPPCPDERFGLFGAGFFDEAADAIAFGRRDSFARTDVAESAFRVSRLNAEGDEVALAGKLGCGLYIGDEMFEVFDEVICGQHEHDRIVAVTGPDLQCAQQQGWCSIAPEGFE